MVRGPVLGGLGGEGAVLGGLGGEGTCVRKTRW